MKGWVSVVLLAVMLTSLTVQAKGTPVLALGADLDDSQREIVLSEMGITEEDVASYLTIYITEDMEQEYLNDTLDSDLEEKDALSSVLLIPQESGSGLDIETHNISYCTVDMYRNALLTVGMEDAKVVVAAPVMVSGTSALIGAVKAYELCSGVEIDKNALEAATDELFLTGELKDELQQAGSETISNLIAFLKQKIAQNKLNDPEKLEKMIKQAAKELNVELTDEQVSKVTDLLLKFGKLDIDANKLVSQAKELYDKIDSLGIKVDGEKVGNFITRFISSIWELIQSFISK